MAIHADNSYFTKDGTLNVSVQQRKEMLELLNGELMRRKQHQVPTRVNSYVGTTIDEMEQLAREQRMENLQRLKNKPYPIHDDDTNDDFKNGEQLRQKLHTDVETEQRQLKVKQLEDKIENLKREHLSKSKKTETKEVGKLLTGLPLNLIFALLVVAAGVVKFFVSAYSPRIETTALSPAVINQPTASAQQLAPISSKAEREMLLALDQRRVELETRNHGLDRKEMELGIQDRIVTEKIAELKSIYGQLQARRQEHDQKREAKLEQLAEVYATMAPEQAAPIIAKLDNETALSLLQRMSGKRMGQILSSMSSDRAIELTKGLRG